MLFDLMLWAAGFHSLYFCPMTKIGFKTDHLKCVLKRAAHCERLGQFAGREVLTKEHCSLASKCRIHALGNIVTQPPAAASAPASFFLWMWKDEVNTWEVCKC